MDVSDLVESKYLTSTDVKNSITKTVTIIGEGSNTDGVNQKGEKYKRVVLPVQIDGKNKEWIPNRNALQKLTLKFASKDTKEWIGKPIRVTTILLQGGKEGITLE